MNFELHFPLHAQNQQVLLPANLVAVCNQGLITVYWKIITEKIDMYTCLLETGEYVRFSASFIFPLFMLFTLKIENQMLWLKRRKD